MCICGSRRTHSHSCSHSSTKTTVMGALWRWQWKMVESSRGVWAGRHTAIHVHAPTHARTHARVYARAFTCSHTNVCAHAHDVCFHEHARVQASLQAFKEVIEQLNDNLPKSCSVAFHFTSLQSAAVRHFGPLDLLWNQKACLLSSSSPRTRMACVRQKLGSMEEASPSVAPHHMTLSGALEPASGASLSHICHLSAVDLSHAVCVPHICMYQGTLLWWKVP